MLFESILNRLINFNTVNNPADGIFPDSKILHYIEALISKWNPDFQSQEFTEGEYSSTYFALNPEKRCDVIFLGHLDVVPVASGWSTDPFNLTVDSGLGYGRGTKDCKGSVLSVLLMLKKLCEESSSILKRIGFYFSLDEESGGKYGGKIFFEHLNTCKILPKYVINVDGGPRVVYKRRGGFGLKIKVPPNPKRIQGTINKKNFTVRVFGDDNRHSAYFVKGCDTHPVITLSKLLHLNRKMKLVNLDGSWIKGNVIPDEVVATLVFPEKNSKRSITFDENLTQLIRQVRSLILIDLPLEEPSEFGISVNPNIVTYTASEGTEIYFDVRAFLSSKKKDILIKSFKSRLNNLKEISKITCSGSTGYFCTPVDNLLVKTASSVLKKHQKPFEPCEQEGASDARYASQYRVPVIDLGPEGGRIHGNNEYIVLNSLKEYSIIYNEIISLLIKSS
ncbi:MAG: M20/M25/M40 family metallo-hydrolase [Candidatus Hodarchaeota archaeon]